MTYNPDRPAWEQLCQLTTGWLLSARSPREERTIWALKMDHRRRYELATDGQAAAEAMLHECLRQQAA